MTATASMEVFADQLRTAGHSEEAIKASLEALTKSLPPRLLEVERRALALGCEVERNRSVALQEDWLSIIVRRNGRQIGSISYWPATERADERFHLGAECSALGGLPMQADWLLENARAVREIFTALVLP